MNEGLKNWVATFLMLANMGMVPAQVVSASAKEKQAFVEQQPQDKIDAALFVKFMTDNGLSDISSAYGQFVKSNPNVKTPLEFMQKHINRSGKQVLYGQNYVKHDYSNVDINKFTPDNWLTDMADAIPDQDEPIINNWISDYEKKTSVEIGIITIKTLDDVPVEDYAQEQFTRLGIGKKYADDGILLVFSMEDHKWRIHTGYGVEGALPDGLCWEIGNNYIKPHFKEGDYEGGIMAALEQIRIHIGDEAYELKKKAEEENRKHADMEFNERMSDILLYLSFAVLIGGIVGAIAYLKRKARLEKEAKEDVLRSIDKTIDDFNKLVKNFPGSFESPSNDLVKSFEDVKNIIKSVSLTVVPGKEKLKQEELDKLDDANTKLYKLLLNTSVKFKNKYDEVEKRKSEISSISNMKLDAYTVVTMATAAAMEIEKLGYSPGQVPSKAQIDRLDDFVNKINNSVSTDFDKASVLFGAYRQQLGSITSQAGEIGTKLKDIRTSIDRVQNWESEVSRLSTEFGRKANSSEKSKVEQMIQDFKSKVSKTKDYVALEVELDNLIASMKRAIKRYDDEERRKREEEEAERRRRRREEEEEEERRRRSYYSSSSSDDSSSSSSSFGGFGGGDSGGGGASGGW
jgi:uncharacterized membrane protein YgcG